MRTGVRNVRVAVFCGSILLALFSAGSSVRAQMQWNATVGAQSRDKGEQVLAFLPNEIWIHQGDSIEWTFEADDIHTVTFLSDGQTRPPFFAGCPGFSGSQVNYDGSTCISTPPLVTGATFTVFFTATGNFKVVCLVHENMTGVVHVLPPQAPLPHDQRFYDKQAESERKDYVDSVGKVHEHGGPKHDHDVMAGIGAITATPGGSGTLSVLRFLDDNMVIHVGDTIEWSNHDPITPHTITFGEEPEDNPGPPSGNVTVDADGARHATIGSTSDNVHSGFIMAALQDQVGKPQTPLGVTRFRVTFTHAGTYPYLCALHDDLGMKGKVIVKP
jgi:plastocyanin